MLICVQSEYGYNQKEQQQKTFILLNIVYYDLLSQSQYNLI